MTPRAGYRLLSFCFISAGANYYYIRFFRGDNLPLVRRMGPRPAYIQLISNHLISNISYARTNPGALLLAIPS